MPEPAGLLRLRIDSARPLAHQLRAAVEAIAAGGVVAYPTDTLYGLAADPRSVRAVAALRALKGRGEDQAVALIAASLEQAAEAAEISGQAQRLAERFWPGPLTLVVPARPGLVDGVRSSRGLVGVRVPDHRVARALAELCGHPITATSANRSGAPAVSDPDEVVRGLPGLGLLIDAGLTPGGPPSTLVEVVGGVARVLREGALAGSRVLESLDTAP